MDLNLVQTVALVTNILTFTGVGIFLIGFAKIKVKSPGLYFILVLSISDLAYPLVNALTTQFVLGQTSAEVYVALSVFLYHFSLTWSTAMAIFCYLILDWRRSIDVKSFILWSVACCCVISTAIACIVGFQIWGVTIHYFSPGVCKLLHPMTGFLNRFLFGLFFHGLGGLLPILITLNYYIKVYNILKDIHIYSSFQAKSARVLWFAAIQIVCFLPEVVIDVYFLIIGQEPGLTPAFIMYILKRCWPFLNLLAYWFLNDVNRMRNSLDRNSTDQSDTQSSFIDAPV